MHVIIEASSDSINLVTFIVSRYAIVAVGYKPFIVQGFVHCRTVADAPPAFAA